MKFNLNVIVRLMLLNNLPEQGNLETMLKKRTIKNKVIFNSEEMDKMNLKTNEYGITWSPIDDIEVEFTNTEIKFIYDVINSMSEKNLIRDDMIDFILIIKDQYDAIILAETGECDKACKAD